MSGKMNIKDLSRQNWVGQPNMKIPNQITILGREISITITDRETISKETGHNDPDGALSYIKRKMFIAEDLPEEEKFVTFFHECNHAIDYITGFAQILDSEKFELLAESRATGFYDVFKGMMGHECAPDSNSSENSYKLGDDPHKL